MVLALVLFAAVAFVPVVTSRFIVPSVALLTAVGSKPVSRLFQLPSVALLAAVGSAPVSSSLQLLSVALLAAFSSAPVSGTFLVPGTVVPEDTAWAVPGYKAKLRCDIKERKMCIIHKFQYLTIRSKSLSIFLLYIT